MSVFIRPLHVGLLNNLGEISLFLREFIEGISWRLAKISVARIRFLTVRRSIRNPPLLLVLHSPRLINKIVYTAGDTLTYAALADLADLVERVIERRSDAALMLGCATCRGRLTVAP